MKKIKLHIGLISILLLTIVGSFVNFGVEGEEYPEGEQISLVYDVIDWEDTEWGVSWSVWGGETIYKGNFTSDPGGKIEVTVTGIHEKNLSTEAWEDINTPYYGDISIFEKINGNYELNFTLTNISFNEAGMILAYGYLGWDPSFKISTDWENNANVALSKRETFYSNATVSIINTSTTVTYDFQQIGGLEQKTILTYNKTNGVLLEAITEFGLYSSHIRLQGYNPNTTIPGYEIPVLLTITFLGIFVISKRKKPVM